ncbi:MAG TPA: coenzyme F420-0:L-glutamate ligase [Phenylobacterium sp.]|uniref:coenzyme F420-0:L-glutamate ligase n=1 Tax=Phenylobacterium sp. TaxID=1871053 RepID=UPI002B464494|nr:coenzyme F420-0:L-glutamate ligase [Phenylobacterium sp.]HKR89873.1 coenzyme F420-0:L-glutamate ligase [Phenylobacterium sp.]
MSVLPLEGLPMFAPGVSIAREVAAAARRQGIALAKSDVVVLAQKIVSKSEGRRTRLHDVAAGDEARALAVESGRPAALMQLMLDESQELVRATPMVVITRHRTGHVAANAGIDASNVEGGAEDAVLLWPVDPDESARAIRAELKTLTGAAPAVVIADSLGRAWRLGTMGAAIGAAGLVVVDDRRGETDLFGRTLQATLVAVADSIAAAGVLVMGEGAEGVPAAIVRGMGRYVGEADGDGAAAGLRPVKEDLFR